MAGRRQDLETRIVAKDDASHVIDKVADELDRLDKKTVDVDVKVDDKASDDLRELDRRLEGLSDEDKTIVLRAQAKDAQRDVDRLIRSLAQVDKMDDEEVKIRVEALGDARRELAQIEEQAERLDKEKVDITVDVDDRATGRFAKFRTQLSEAEGGFGKIAVAGKAAFANLGQYAGEAGLAAAAAIGLFVKSAVTDFQTLALEVGKLRDVLGIPAEEVSKLKEVVEDLGIPIGAFQAAVVRMNRAAETTPAAFDNINAAIVRSDDGALEVTETFLGVATALDAIPDAGQRAAAGAQIFGKGWTQIAELVEKGGLSIREAMEQVGEAKIVDDEDITDAKAMREAVDDLRDRFEEFSNSVGRDVIPVVTTLIDMLGKLSTATGEAISVLQGDLPGPSFIDSTLGKVVKYVNPITGFVNTVNAGADAWDRLNGNMEASVDPMLFAVSGMEDLNTALADLAAQKDPLSVMGDQWKILMEDMADGSIDTQEAADAANLLAGVLGKEVPEVLGIAGQAIDDNKAKMQEWEQATVDAVAESIEVVTDFRDTLIDAALKVADTNGQLRDLAGVFKQIGTRGDAFRRIFDLKNAPIDAEAAVRDIEIAIDDLSEAAKDVDLSEGLDPSNVNADALLDAIDSLRPQIQEKVVEAFSAGGPEAATALATDYVAQVADELGVSEIEAAKLLGMEDIEALVTVAIEQTSLANAQAQLDILTGLTGANPLTASIQMALDTGTITPRQAQILVQDALLDAGVEIPAELLLKTTERQLTNAYKAVGIDPDTPIGQPLKVLPTGFLAAAEEIAEGPPGGWPPIKVLVKPVFPSGLIPGSGGPGAGGFAAGPLAVGPMAMTAGVTPMSGPSLPTLMLPVGAAPRAATQPIVINQTIQAAVIGSPFDVMTAVDEANRRAARLLPREP